MEAASRYQIYVVSIQEKESFNSQNGEVFTSYSGDPIHGLTQIDAPAEVVIWLKLNIKSSLHYINKKGSNFE